MLKLERQRFKHINLQYFMEKLLCFQEHFSCNGYDRDTPGIIDSPHYHPGECWEGKAVTKKIIFILTGSMQISYGFFIDRKIGAGNIYLLPPGCCFTARTGEGVSLLVIRIVEAIHFCENNYLEDLELENPDAKTDLQLLEIKPPLHSFLSLLSRTLSDGLRCKHFFKLKTKEMLYLLRTYYTKKELGAFFRPLLSTDAQFTEFVLRNYHRVKTVSQFASLNSCSLSNFDKKFRRAFGTSAYQWMMQKCNEQVFHEIKTTNKPFLQIAEEQGFSSNSQFTDYCKKHLGGTPGKIRGTRNAGTHRIAYRVG